MARIVVIDSGVHPTHPHIDATRLLPGCAILADGTVLTDAHEALDKLGHGTAVTAAIQELAPQAEILTIRVFRDGLRASARALATGIRQALEAECDLINLSLGTASPAACRSLRPVGRGSDRPRHPDCRRVRGRRAALLAGMPAASPRRRSRLGPAAWRPFPLRQTSAWSWPRAIPARSPASNRAATSMV